MDASEGTDELAGLFPKLATEGFEILEPPTVRYNCIAFAAGDTGNWWSFHQPEYWPGGATRSNSIDSLVEVFAAIGFEQCDAGGVEPGFEKVRAVRTTRPMDTCFQANTERHVAQQNGRRTRH